jgi:hypothetical protein
MGLEMRDGSRIARLPRPARPPALAAREMLREMSRPIDPDTDLRRQYSLYVQAIRPGP